MEKDGRNSPPMIFSIFLYHCYLSSRQLKLTLIWRVVKFCFQMTHALLQVSCLTHQPMKSPPQKPLTSGMLLPYCATSPSYVSRHTQLMTLHGIAMLLLSNTQAIIFLSPTLLPDFLSRYVCRDLRQKL